MNRENEWRRKRNRIQELKKKEKILTPSSTGLSHKGPVPEYQDDRQSFLQNQLRVHPKMVWKDFLPAVVKV